MHLAVVGSAFGTKRMFGVVEVTRRFFDPKPAPVRASMHRLSKTEPTSVLLGQGYRAAPGFAVMNCQVGWAEREMR